MAIPGARLWSLRPALLFALGLIVAGATAAPTLRRPAATTYRQVGATGVGGVDARGRLVWQRELGGEFVENYRVRSLGNATNPVDRIVTPVTLHDARGRMKCWPISVQPPSGPGLVRLLDARGRTVRTLPLPWRAVGDVQLNKLNCQWIAAVPWEPRHEEVMALHVRDNRYAPTATHFVAASGESLGTYYHYGHLNFSTCDDLDGDGRAEVLLFGVNNRARRDRDLYPVDPEVYIDCLVLLEVPEVSGQAWPWTDWDGIAPAREEAYLLLPPLGPGHRPEIYSVDIGGPVGTSPRAIEVVLADGRIYRLDSNLVPLSCGHGDGTAVSKRVPLHPAAPLYHWKMGERTAIDLLVE